MLDQLSRAVADRERRGVGVSTVERVRHAGEDAINVSVETDNEGGHLVRVERQRVAQALLDQLKARGTINDREHKAGDRFRRDAYLAGAFWSASMPLEPSGRNSKPGAYGPMRTENAAAAAKRLRKATAGLSGGLLQVAEYLCLGSEENTLAGLGKAFNGVWCDDTTARVIGRTLAKLALSTLADRYGL